ncbi:tyrosine-type recombinase/integrase [Amycolatopsis sp. NPDC049688]|uniref:site-specific integrase n=1 Tax=Amycolatopsis sp. NPDC049688 TaxID=3154733 RepID=UPI0034419F63
MAWAEPLPGGGYRGGYKIKVDGKYVNRYVSDDGKGFRRKSDAKEAAEDAAAQARRRAAAAAATPKAAKMTWGQWWDIFAAKRYRDRVNDLWKVEARAIDTHIRPRWGNVPLNEIKHTDVQEWVAEDLAPGRKWNTVRTIYSPFRVSMNATVKQKPPILDASPCVGVELPKPKRRRRKRQLTGSDETVLSRRPERGSDAIGGYLHPRYARAMRFQRRTGVRPGELAGLHADQIDFERREVTISNVYVTSHGAIRAYPKDEEDRVVPLLPEAIDAAHEALAGRPLTGGCGVRHADGSKCDSVIVFLAPRGGLVTPEGYKAALRRGCKKAKIPLVSPYSVRRGFATWAKDCGVDPFTIQLLLGHATLDQTADYVLFTEAARQQFLVAMGEPVQLRVVEERDDLGAGHEAQLDRTQLDTDGIERSSVTA